MKKLLLLIAVFCATTVYAQDVIVKKDGSTILSKVIKIGTTEVEYKKFSNQNGPNYSIQKNDIQAINYENGDKDEFKTEAQEGEKNNVSKNATPQLVNKPADARNAELIAKYNKEFHSTGKWETSDKTAKSGYVMFWVSPSSVMSNDELEMSFEQRYWKPKKNYVPYYYNVIVLRNKTNKFIYVDLAKTFRNFSTGDTRCYYDAEQTTISNGSASGASVGLGGIAGALGVGGVIGQVASGVAVGGGKSSTVATTYTSQRIISIPPNGQRCLSEYKNIEVNGHEFKKVSSAEHFEEIQLNLKDRIKSGETTYDEETNSPFTINYTITYSTSEDFNTYSTLYSKLFVKTIVARKNRTKSQVVRTFERSGFMGGTESQYISGITPETLFDYYAEF